MWFSYLFFIVVGAIALAAAVGVVAAKVPVHSALFLLVQFAMLAALYITMDAQFLGAAQIIIYAGGIVILILFVIMLIGSEEIQRTGSHRRWIPWAALALGLILLGGIAVSRAQAFRTVPPNPGPNMGGTPPVVGIELFTKYILPIEMVGVLLLVALIGALLLAHRQVEPLPGPAEPPREP